MLADVSSRVLNLFLFLLLIILNSSTVLVGKYTRSSVAPDQRYDVAHFMIVTEFLKLVLSLIAERFFSDNNNNNNTIWTDMLQSFLSDYIRMTIPALLYLIQNSMIYYSLSYLSVPTFQVLYQSKLIMTAILSSLFLNSKYNIRQWGGLLLVTVGVTVVVTLSETKQDETGMKTSPKHLSDTSLGILLVFISCICSSLAGVYFEAVIKNISSSNPCPSCWNHEVYCIKLLNQGETSSNNKVVSVWMRNLQLSVLTLMIAFVQEMILILYEYNSLATTSNHHPNFFKGFTSWVYLQIWLLGGGGLVVAIVIKYTDNVQKGIATGLSVIVSTLLSNVIFGTTLTIYFTLGTVFVLLGLILFNDDLFVSCTSLLRFRMLKYWIPLCIIVMIVLTQYFSFTMYDLNKMLYIDAEKVSIKDVSLRGSGTNSTSD